MKTVFECHSCCDHHETEKGARDCCEPEELYACPACDTTWETRTAAKECCDPVKLYLCEACSETHDDEGLAETCCSNPNGRPNAAYLERLGQLRLIRLVEKDYVSPVFFAMTEA